MSIEKRAITEDPATWEPPAGFDEYKLIRPLGSGRMGSVYLAHDELLDRHVAVKFMATIDDDALARFLVEARAAARLQHPNVATLYRVGQLDGRPYMIYELVRGTSLDRVPKPMDPDEVLKIGIDLARGLAAAHRRGVLHRDIKPGNTILTDTGEAKLLDFGVAKLIESAVGDSRAAHPEGPRALSDRDEAALGDLTQGQLLGTPYFMSPEAWRREASERSDLYSLGLMLYELVAGKGPFRDVPLAELPRAVMERDPRPLRSVAPSAPEGLALAIDRCVRRDPAERFASADHLLAALESLRPSRATGRVPEGNPYRGLRPFESEHRALFFGRQRALTAALDRLRVERFLVVTGDSGVGKSSLCAAGIVPMALEGALEDGRTWSMARMVPGRAPLFALVSALAPVLGLGETELEAARADPRALGRVVARRLPRHDGLLVYIDQFEELVTLSEPAEAALAAEAIGALAGGLPGVRVLGTARSDFLSRLEALPGLSGQVSRALFLLAPLGREEVREAIVGPASVKHVRFASDATVDLLVDSTMAAQGAMPLLQFALAELWERRDAAAGVIPAAALDELGGVSGALSRHADALIAALMPVERAAARAVMLRLVTVEGTRARRLDDELATSPAARAALDALVRGRLVVAGDSAEGATYEIAHEALLAGWSTLARWLAEAAEARALHHRIETAAAAWRAQPRRDLLWGARQLQDVAALSPDELTPREHAFLAASRRASKRSRWLRRGVAAAVVLGGAGIWAGAQIEARIARENAITSDLARADKELASARAMDAELLRGRAAAFAAFGAGKTDEGETAWANVVSRRAATSDAYRVAGQSIERALLRDSDRGDVRHRLAALLYERAIFAERETQPTSELLARMTLYDDDGAARARWNAPARLEITTEPAGAIVTARRVVNRDGRYALDAPRPLGPTPLAGAQLEFGSYVLELASASRPPITYPLVVERGATHRLNVRLPDRTPDDYAWIPSGPSRIGTIEDESVRRFFKALPAHTVELPAFAIARHETTFGEWIEYLNALSPTERERRRPRAGDLSGGAELRRSGAGRWELHLVVGGTTLRAEQGQPLRYPTRTENASQDWTRMPVVGISCKDAIAYTTWLDTTRRLPGARLCEEREWERAARGADDRLFPHGDVLHRTDANVDVTYGDNASSKGPDEVGRHPASRSPFGVDDLAGNVWEWVASDATADRCAARGGAFYYAVTTARIANRELPDGNYRDMGLGMRVCVDASP